MSEQPTKPPGIKDIASALGISIGTVDRALHGRSDVSANTRARVLKEAEQLGYRPNMVARSLKLNRQFRVGVYLPRQIASFFDPLREGIRAAAAAYIGINVDLDFHSFPRLDEGELEELESAVGQNYDGLLLTPGDPGRIDSVLRRIARQGTAIICVGNDAPRSGRLAAVSTDSYTSGAIAAEMLARTIQKSAAVATITGELTIMDHAEKLRGFAATLAVLAPHLSLLPVIESHESPKEAYRQASALLSRKPRPAGLYISTANSIPVLQALDEHLLKDVQVITTDLFPELIPLLESGKILATLHQRPFVQGRTAFESLARYLVEGVQPEPVTKLAPHIVLRSNLPLFLSQMIEPEDSGSKDPTPPKR